jgi:hypothetical protein
VRQLRLFFLVGLLLSQGAAADVLVPVTATNLGPWRFGPLLSPCGNGFAGTTSFVSGPGIPPLGSGSLQIDIPPDSPLSIFFGSALDGALLTSLTELRYSTFVAISTPSAVAPRLVLTIETLPNSFDQIEFQPQLQGVVAIGAWQSWNALAGNWKALFGPPQPPFTLAAYAAAHPGAHLAAGAFGPGMAIVSGCDGNRMRANVDDLRIATGGPSTIFDFEVFPTIPALDPWAVALLAAALLIVGVHKLS